MTTEERSALTTPPEEFGELRPLMPDERVAELESRVTAMELALRRAFGERWMGEQARRKDDDEK